MDFYSTERGTLLTKLLDSVIQLQLKFCDKAELATESDGSVFKMCEVFVQVLQHGKKKLNSSSVSLKQISELTGLNKLTTMLNFNDTPSKVFTDEEQPVFWHMVQNHISRHELERFMTLKKVQTDMGRGRAWLRASLNEHFLEKYLHMIINNEEIIDSHYEKWAYLQDDEKAVALPNLAAGLKHILFALNIDNNEFDIIKPYFDESSLLPVINKNAFSDGTKLKNFNTLYKTICFIENPPIVKKKFHRKAKIINFDDDTKSDKIIYDQKLEQMNQLFSSCTILTTLNDMGAIEESTNPNNITFTKKLTNSDSNEKKLFVFQVSDNKESINIIENPEKVESPGIQNDDTSISNSISENFETNDNYLIDETNFSNQNLNSSKNLNVQTSSEIFINEIENKEIESNTDKQNSEVVKINSTNSSKCLNNVRESKSFESSFEDNIANIPEKIAIKDNESLVSSSKELISSNANLLNIASNDDSVSESYGSYDSADFYLKYNNNLISQAGNSFSSYLNIIDYLTLSEDSIEKLTSNEMKEKLFILIAACKEYQRKECLALEKFEKESKKNLKLEIKLNDFLNTKSSETEECTNLKKENVLLKTQLLQYINAVKTLKNEDVEADPDYERKLMQMAEMHGELIQFNEHLQKKFVSLELALKESKRELTSVTSSLIPCTNKNVKDSIHSNKLSKSPIEIIVSIPTVFLKTSENLTYHVYQVNIQIKEEEWNIYRRYTEFYDFNERLIKQYSIIKKFDFPPKKTFGNKGAKTIETRQKKLEDYLKRVMLYLPITKNSLLKNLSKQSLVLFDIFFKQDVL